MDPTRDSWTCSHCGYLVDTPNHNLGCPIGRGESSLAEPPTSDSLDTLIADCTDPWLQKHLYYDIWLTMWPTDCMYAPLKLTREEAEYAASGFGQADVLDMMWSSCKNKLN